MNCTTQLQSKYCHVCGQRQQRRVASVLSLFGEFISETVDWDSRLWRTLWPLFFKPGHLTKAYMEGKRERFIPPFRLYLISSVVFFLVISFAPKAMFDDIGKAVDEKMGGRDQPITSQIDREVMKSIFEDAGVSDVTLEEEDEEDEQDSAVLFDVSLDDRDVKGVDDPPASELAAAPETEDAADTAEAALTDEEPPGETELSAIDTAQADAVDEAGETSTAADGQETDGTDDSQPTSVKTVVEMCEQVKTAELGEWELLRPYLFTTCLSFSTWNGVLQFAEELLDNLPKTLLILLPLMALVNKFLYLFAGRYYVEHLLYYVHNFSFLFLFYLALSGLSAIVGLTGVEIGDVVFPLGMLYTIYYFIKSMRVVYEQGRFFTFIKWLILIITFFVMTFLVLTLLTLATAALHAL